MERRVEPGGWGQEGGARRVGAGRRSQEGGGRRVEPGSRRVDVTLPDMKGANS